MTTICLCPGILYYASCIITSINYIQNNITISNQFTVPSKVRDTHWNLFHRGKIPEENPADSARISAGKCSVDKLCLCHSHFNDNYSCVVFSCLTPMKILIRLWFGSHKLNNLSHHSLKGVHFVFDCLNILVDRPNFGSKGVKDV